MQHSATLNIGLSNAPSPQLATQERFQRALARVRRDFPAATGVLALSIFVGPDGHTEEPSLVVGVSSHRPDVLRAAVYAIACDLGQDCIAVLYDEGAGELLGPHAKRWGRFDSAAFVTMEQALAAAQEEAVAA